MADFLANYVFSFAGTNNYSFSNSQQLPGGAKALLDKEKEKLPSLRIKKVQNEDFVLS